MFSNQKNNFFKGKWFYGIIVLFLLAFGIWVNTDTETQKANTNTKVEQEASSAPKESSVVDSLGQRPSERTDESHEKSAEESTEPSSEEAQQPYYLIKEVEGVVKVFYCDEKGQETLHQITAIPFQLLGKEDQQMMSDGVRVDTEEKLAGFLENFDS
ncbi:MAG: hypothetical protein HFE75_03485 [Firmicutes bacterium]|jgi:cytoskeletal protein RodZ|nr:hypothetical protein [Bacillota bacterium]NBI63245.1 hypothetical protein [Clostridiales bacterium]